MGDSVAGSGGREEVGTMIGGFNNSIIINPS